MREFSPSPLVVTLCSLSLANLTFSPRPLVLFLQFVNKNSPLSYVAKAFGAENWKRLKEIKRTFDPSNVFRFSLGGGIGTAADEEEELASNGKGKAPSS